MPHVGSIPEPVEPGTPGWEAHWPAPSSTIGYRAIAWMEENLLQPDGPDAGEPLKLALDQQHFIAWWYRHDLNGKFVHRSGSVRRSKGTGKSVWTGALALFELCGPCVPYALDAFGNSIGREHPAPLVQLAAVSLAQNANTYSQVRGMISPKLRETHGLDDGQTRILMEHRTGRRIRRGRLEPVTTSSRSLEGNRTSFAAIDEPHHLVEANGGVKLAEALYRNAAKVSGRVLETTNAHAPGENSVAENTYEAFLKTSGLKFGGGLLYSALEGFPEVDLGNPESVRASLEECYRYAPWVDLDRLLAEIYDPRTRSDTVQRFYFSRVVAASDAWIDPAWVDSAVSDEGIPEPGAIVALGFDGSRGGDATALVASDVRTGLCWTLGVWQRPDEPGMEEWQMPYAEIDAAVRQAFERYRIAAFFADYAYFESYVDKWAEEFHDALFMKAGLGHSIAFDMRRRLRDFTQAAESVAAAFMDHSITIEDDQVLKWHLTNARRRLNQYGVSLGKESRESKRKVDLAVSLVLAREARRKALEAGVLDKWADEVPGHLYGADFGEMPLQFDMSNLT